MSCRARVDVNRDGLEKPHQFAVLNSDRDFHHMHQLPSDGCSHPRGNVSGQMKVSVRHGVHHGEGELSCFARILRSSARVLGKIA